MLRLAILILVLPRLAHAFDVAKCVGSAVASPDAATVDAIAGETLGPPPVVATFVHLDAAARAKLAAAVEASLPAAWHPHVELDATGMAHRLVLALPERHTAAELAAPLLAFVKVRACLFGITAPKELTVHADGYDVLFERAPHRIGGLHARVTAGAHATEIELGSHLWPVGDARPALDLAHQLARYLHRSARFDREMFGVRAPDGTYTAPGHMRFTRDTFEQDFKVSAGPMIFCSRDQLVVRAGLLVELGADPIAPVLKELPGVVDRRGTLLPGAWIAPVLVEPTEGYTPDDRLGPGAADCLGVAAP